MLISLPVSTDFETVYEPAEDSFILLDALEIEIKKIQDLKPTFALEIGPGSGIISAAIANITVDEKQLKKLCFVFSCDINLSACKATQLTVNQNNVSSNVGVVCSNLVQALIHRFNQNIDIGKHFFNILKVFEHLENKIISKAWVNLILKLTRLLDYQQQLRVL